MTQLLYLFVAMVWAGRLCMYLFCWRESKRRHKLTWNCRKCANISTGRLCMVVLSAPVYIHRQQKDISTSNWNSPGCSHTGLNIMILLMDTWINKNKIVLGVSNKKAYISNKMLKMTSFFIVPFNMAVVVVSLHNCWPDTPQLFAWKWLHLPVSPLKWLWSYSPCTVFWLKMTLFTNIPIKMAGVHSLHNCWHENDLIFHIPFKMAVVLHSFLPDVDLTDHCPQAEVSKQHPWQC